MKRPNQLLERVADPDNLRLACWKAAKGKRHAAAVLAYTRCLEDNLAHLRTQILEGSVAVGRYHFFKIYDPKERQICAAPFGEQVLHHALMNVCHPYFERAQIYDSYACRQGKGTYAALRRAAACGHRYAWHLKLDVRKYFDSIHHGVLEGQLARLFKDWRLLELLGQIVDSYPPKYDADTVERQYILLGRGVPIGNLTSQYFANHYLCGLDHYIKEQLRIPAYVRYMDDMVLWSDEQSELVAALAAVRAYVEDRLRCSLKTPVLNRSKFGLSFLGYRLFPHHIGLTHRSKQRYIQKIHTIEANYKQGIWDEIRCRQHALPLTAFTQHANAQGLRQRVLEALQT